MKMKKSLLIILSILAVIIIGFFSVVYYYYSQGSVDNYIPPEEEAIEIPVDQAVADMKKIASALETYYSLNFEYPEALEQLIPDVMDALPKDPSNNQEYVYTTDIDENYSISVPDPNSYNLTILKIENGEIIKQ
jgi:hypothetical protein